jgi:hypothetical protein
MQGEFKQLVDAAGSYVVFIILAIWGGTANYVSRRKNDALPFSFIELVGEWTISGFAGLVTVLLCQEFGLSNYLTYAAAGIAGHMGGRSILLIEQWFMRKVRN